MIIDVEQIEALNQTLDYISSQCSCPTHDIKKVWMGAKIGINKTDNGSSPRSVLGKTIFASLTI